MKPFPLIFLAAVLLILASYSLNPSPAGHFIQPPAQPQSYSVEEANYIYGPGGLAFSLESSGPGIEQKYYHQDRLGSTKAVTDSSGSVSFSTDYQPFGQRFNQVGQAIYKFTGQEEDGTGLDYFGARYYSPELGRFTQVDPVSNPGISPYIYANDNPMKYIDPEGKSITLSDSYLEKLDTYGIDFSKLIRKSHMLQRIAASQDVHAITSDEDYIMGGLAKLEWLATPTDSGSIIRISHSEANRGWKLLRHTFSALATIDPLTESQTSEFMAKYSSAMGDAPIRGEGPMHRAARRVFAARNVLDELDRLGSRGVLSEEEYGFLTFYAEEDYEKALNNIQFSHEVEIGSIALFERDKAKSVKLKEANALVKSATFHLRQKPMEIEPQGNPMSKLGVYP